MTFGQEDILRYIKTHYEEGYKTVPVGDGIIEITENNGKTLRLTCNIFSDIMDADTGKIIAKSDLPHNLDSLPIYSRPKSWKKI